MIRAILICLVFTYAAQAQIDAERLANAIYKAEGGARAKQPYGILSVKLKGATAAEREAYARRICLNTIRNNYKRWQSAGSPGEYIDFLANRYCLSSADPVGNRNWKKNVKALYK